MLTIIQNRVKSWSAGLQGGIVGYLADGSMPYALISWNCKANWYVFEIRIKFYHEYILKNRGGEGG